MELFALILVVLTCYIALSNYSALPDTIPTHFDAGGNPDDWGSKGGIFLLPAMSAADFLFLTLLNFWFAVADDPRRFINLPGRRKSLEALTKAQAETMRIFLNRSLFTLKILTLGLFAYLTWQTVEIALGRASSTGLWLWLFIGAILLLVGYMIWKSFRLVKTPSG